MVIRCLETEFLEGSVCARPHPKKSKSNIKNKKTVMLIENNNNDNQSGFYLTNPKILDATAQKMKFSIKDYFSK